MLDDLAVFDVLFLVLTNQAYQLDLIEQDFLNLTSVTMDLIAIKSLGSAYLIQYCRSIN